MGRFVTRNGSVKVLDLGSARTRRYLGEWIARDRTGMMLGTPAFMAPEQALGRSREIDGRTGGMGILGGSFPAIRAARINPVQATRGG
jgi:serine/threonine protein kinase